MFLTYDFNAEEVLLDLEKAVDIAGFEGCIERTAPIQLYFKIL